MNCYLAPTKALCRIRMDWIQVLLPCWCGGRAERGDSANGPNAQRRTAAQIHTQAGMRRQARRPLNRIRRPPNREGVVSGGGALSERAEGGGLPETGASPIVRSWSRNPKFDTRLPVSKAGGAALPRARPRRFPRCGFCPIDIF